MGAQLDEIAALDSLLEREAIESVFQPIVDLVTGLPVAFEALTRGPAHSPMHEPAAMFRAARPANRLADLDWACRMSALDRALQEGLRPPVTIFLNVEPEVLDDEPPDDHHHVLARAMGGLRVVVELTERALLAHPAALLAYVEELRRRGWGIAVDDIGAHPQSVAMLPVIEPDVVKLDRRMLHEMAPSDATALMAGVHEYCRRSGAVMVAEGLETEDQVAGARAAGAHLGQGWALGKPTAHPGATTTDIHPIPFISPRPHQPTRRLISMATRQVPAVSGVRRDVDRLTYYLSSYAERLGCRTLLVVAAQNHDELTPPVVETLERLAKDLAYVALIGVGVGGLDIAGVHTVDLGAAEPLASEWVVVATGLPDSIALVASDLGDSGPREDRRYEFAVSYDPVLVTDIARALLSRIA